MAKTKSKAVLMAADGAGGMAQIHDRRFEGGDWPIRFEVAEDQADTWLQYLTAECGRRGWSCADIRQMDRGENSGSITISRSAPGQPQLAVVWERKREGPIKIRARTVEPSGFVLADAEDLLKQVTENCAARVMERFFRRGLLYYDGLPWRGELLLDDALRLGPPSRQDEAALLRPRVILIDAQINGIDWSDANSSFMVLCREVSVFLSVVMRREVRFSPMSHQAWTWVMKPEGQTECDVRELGYLEAIVPQGMPARGEAPPVPLTPVQRPDFSVHGITADEREQTLPADIVELWQLFSGLVPERRKQFLQVGTMWQVSRSLSHEFQTAAFAWMVAACEALKPSDPAFRDSNIYHVVEALLGRPRADLLREDWFKPQEVRSSHLHSGELHGFEFARCAMMSSFEDPSFRQANDLLWETTSAAIIEWLKRGGTFTMPQLKRARGRRRAVMTHAAIAVGLALGLALGWLLRGAWPR